METKINCVLLVEDSEATINYNKRLIQRSYLVNHIEIALNGSDALEFVKNVSKENFPELILLDLNMPLLGGIGFLEQYDKIARDEKNQTKVVLLSTSLLESDIRTVSKFINHPTILSKPLTKEKLSMIWNNNL